MTDAVFGCGGVGLNVSQGASLFNASKIIAVDSLDLKLEFSRQVRQPPTWSMPGTSMSPPRSSGT